MKLSTISFRTISAIAALSVLVGCAAEPPAPIPRKAGELAAQGKALVVTRGFVRNSYGAIKGDFDFWNNNKNTGIDLLSKQGMIVRDTGEYYLQVVDAGSYQLVYVQIGTDYLEARDPAGSAFTVKPGEVVYLGDIELRDVAGHAVAGVTDQSEQARAAVAAQAPQFVQKLQTRILNCSVCVRR